MGQLKTTGDALSVQRPIVKVAHGPAALEQCGYGQGCSPSGMRLLLLALGPPWADDEYLARSAPNDLGGHCTQKASDDAGVPDRPDHNQVGLVTLRDLQQGLAGLGIHEQSR